MRYGIGVALALALTATTSAGAQQPQRIRAEIRPYVGAYLPSGKLADDFKAATTLGLQAALEVNSFMHLLGTAGFTYGRNKFGFADDLTYIWQYDVGAEFNLNRALGDNWLLKPFAGAGAGARTYDYQAANVGTNSCTAGYAALGSELQKGVIAMRLEGRSYLACFKSPLTGDKNTRSDFGIAFGVAYHVW